MSKPHNHAPGAKNAATSPVVVERATEMVAQQNALAAQSNQVMVPQSFQDDQVLRSDIIVPYLVKQEGMSDFVQARKAQIGDICKSTNPTKLGDPEHPIEVIFLHNPKAEWALEQKQAKSDKFKFRRAIERNGVNENQSWSYWSDDQGLVELPANSPGATEWKRVKRLSVFALLVSDIEAEKIERVKASVGDLPDPSKALTPVIISFRVMSYNGGKEVSTFFTQAKSLGVAIWRYRMPMAVVFESNDRGSYYVWAPDRNNAKAVAKEDLPTVTAWAQIVGSGKGLKVDESGEQSGDEKVPF